MTMSIRRMSLGAGYSRGVTREAAGSGGHVTREALAGISPIEEPDVASDRKSREGPAETSDDP